VHAGYEQQHRAKPTEWRDDAKESTSPVEYSFAVLQVSHGDTKSLGQERLTSHEEEFGSAATRLHYDGLQMSFGFAPYTVTFVQRRQLTKEDRAREELEDAEQHDVTSKAGSGR